ncbi:Kunitz-type U15-theraphotoxin-Hhn1o [Dirofilaria immitis]
MDTINRMKHENGFQILHVCMCGATQLSTLYCYSFPFLLDGEVDVPQLATGQPKCKPSSSSCRAIMITCRISRSGSQGQVDRKKRKKKIRGNWLLY